MLATLYRPVAFTLIAGSTHLVPHRGLGSHIHKSSKEMERERGTSATPLQDIMPFKLTSTLLDSRLAPVAALVLEGGTTKACADIGTGQAFLAMTLAENGLEVVACDIREETLLRAKKNCELLHPSFRSKIDLRLGDGLETLQQSSRYSCNGRSCVPGIDTRR